MIGTEHSFLDPGKPGVDLASPYFQGLAGEDDIDMCRLVPVGPRLVADPLA